MKIIIAPDSFKDSLSASEAADAIELGLREVFPDADLIKCPMADGGEGTVDAILSAVPGELRIARVTGPVGEMVQACWGWLPESRTAIIEMAEASGLQRVPMDHRDACVSTTRGTGELIREALDAGASSVVLTLGGSATNDGGAGMLEALGVRFLDVSHRPLPPGGLALAALHSIELDDLDPRLTGVDFQLAADVDNPLCGPQGASFTFGRQKVATTDQLVALDQALNRFADCCESILGERHRDFAGSGAAGGLGFAARAFLRATFRPGVEVVAEMTQLASHLKGADLVITGEGRLDAQTLRGKTPLGVGRLACEHDVSVIVLAGTLGEGYEELYSHGIAAAFALTPGPMTLEEACRQAPDLLRERARDVGRLLKMAGRFDPAASVFESL
ncbi:glycerate kinase [Halopseudomonas xinjiangensis]|uniref:Glycerate kinase n=1 Tax=Halopseudomonas xinjiangensis TaxID=487184 RepID=A0A1H1SUV4_9GAMM|nr:glycerate kinase [Halopseudomonas xinjiangensis]SDS51745.1 glycerate kinase [Halopseudomonas xinjiangensis]